MSYNSAMFHKMAEEVHRITYESHSNESIDRHDMFTMLDAIALIAANKDMGFCSDMAGLAASEVADTIWEEHELEESVMEQLADELGYEHIGSELHDVYVRRND